MYLRDLYRVERPSVRQGWGATLRVEDGRTWHCSRMSNDTLWFIDSEFDNGDAVHNYGFGERGDGFELHPLKVTIGVVLDHLLEGRGLLEPDAREERDTQPRPSPE